MQRRKGYRLSYLDILENAGNPNKLDEVYELIFNKMIEMEIKKYGNKVKI